jgi:hypothetical protein
MLSKHLALAAILVAGCATQPSPQELDQQAQAMIKASFREQGIAKMDRLDQDLGQAACSADKPPAEEVAKRVEAQAYASIQPPQDGRYIGDWREGEKLAQNGRRERRPVLQLPPARPEGNLLRHHRPQPVELRQDPRRQGPGRPRIDAHRPVHLGQAVEQQGLFGLLQHAALRPRQAAERAADPRRDGPAAGPEVAGQPVAATAARLRAGSCPRSISLIAES